MRIKGIIELATIIIFLVSNSTGFAAPAKKQTDLITKRSQIFSALPVGKKSGNVQVIESNPASGIIKVKSGNKIISYDIKRTLENNPNVDPPALIGCVLMAWFPGAVVGCVVALVVIGTVAL